MKGKTSKIPATKESARHPGIPRYYLLLVRFERDLPALQLPYLGQALFMGHVDRLLEGRPVRLPGEFGARWSDAETGWKTFSAVGGALKTEDAEQAGVLEVGKQLKAEADSLARALEGASHRDIRFRLFLAEYAEPLPDLALWATREFDEFKLAVMELLRQNGVKIDG